MTPPPVPDAPISKLDRGLLWKIFSIISDTRINKEAALSRRLNQSPLVTLRICSQVCASWRDLILDSSSLWGNCIHLDFLAQDHGNWRNEVLQRTGTAPLSIYSTNETIELPTDVHVYEFLIDLIQSHWTRIQLLDVVVESRIFNDERVWRAFGHPAPNLRVFSMLFCDSQPLTSSEQSSMIHPENFRLFAGDAPVLDRFFLWVKCEFIIPFGIPPLPSVFFTTQIRDLRLHCAQIEASDILAACLHMPRLEKLGVRIAPKSMRDILSTSGHSVILPRLELIEVVVQSLDVYGFLGHITPHPGCVLRLDTFLDPIDEIPTPTRMIDANIKDMQRMVSRYTHDFFDHLRNTPDRVTRMMLSIELNHLAFRTDEHTFGCDLVPSLSSHTQGIGIPYSVFKPWVNAISTLKFPDTIVQLDLHLFKVSDDLRTISSSYLSQHIADDHHLLSSSLRQLFSSLRSVIRLNISASAFSSLVCLCDSQNYAPFPSLKDLYLDTGKDSLSEDNLDGLKPFLARRKHMTPPLETLDLINCSFSSVQNLEYLDEYTGLTVVRLVDVNSDMRCTATRYVCGSGNPQILLMRPEWWDLLG